MKLNLPVLTLCLLGAVVLCKATSISPITENFTSPAVTESAFTTENSTDSNFTSPTSNTTDQPATSPTESATTRVVGVSPQGLSGGEIAGITVGSIAGVAAIGGGVFGALKYTGRI